MAPPRRRFAKAPTTRRYLAHRHERAKIAAQQQQNQQNQQHGLLDGDVPPAPPDPTKVPLRPGYKQVVSFDRPGLLAGVHTISVSQDIRVSPDNGKQPPDPPDLTAPEMGPLLQAFEVAALRFELPADAVYSIYPDEGHEATVDVLPHIVFNDAALPWERVGSAVAEDHNPGDFTRNRVPWLALLTFTPDELKLSDDELKGILAPTSLKDKKDVEQTEKLSVSVPVADLPLLGKGSARSPFTDTAQATQQDVAVIFPPAWLFNALFSAYDDAGKPTAIPAGCADLSRHRFLAHVARINTAGMAHADSEADETTREFGVVVASRTGPLTGDKPSPVIVHLVSLEGLESKSGFGKFPVDGATTRVALASLHSWSYTCLPPTALDVRAAFMNLAGTAGMLCAAVPDVKTPDAVTERLKKRLLAGYTVIRSVAPTGEETAALLRGAFTPDFVPPIGWQLLENGSSGLNVVDGGLGMLDATYAAAWSLGRTLALADRAFTISLARVRHALLDASTAAARKSMVQATGRTHYGRKELARVLGPLIDGAVVASRHATRDRWAQPASAAPPDLTYAAIGPFMEAALEEAAADVAASLDTAPEDRKRGYAPPYDEFNEPASPDWMMVVRFVLDLYYLVNVPSHYLITDPGLLPRESLRFFFIDHNWIDALVDGALSLGNHGGSADAFIDPDGPPVDDPVRRAIKRAINRLFTDPLCRRPAVPRFGFYMRSAVVAQFPDLKVSVEVSGSTSGAAYLLRHDIIEKETMFGLFSDAPLKDGLHGLRFDLPPHQQYFSVGTFVDGGLDVPYRRQYTVADPSDSDRNKSIAEVRWVGNGAKGRAKDCKDLRERPPVFVWGTADGENDVRLLLAEKLVPDVHATLLERMPGLNATWYTETAPTSALAATQLSCPAWQLQVGTMRADPFASAAVVHGAARVDGTLSCRREARPREPAKAVDAATVLPPMERRPPPGPGLQSTPRAWPRQAVSSTVVWRMKEALPPPKDSDPPPPPPPPPPGSWTLVDSDAGSDAADGDWDADFDGVPAGAAPPLCLVRLGSGPEGVPQFDFHVSTTRAPSERSVGMLATSQDLVFSIVYNSFGAHFALKSLTLHIPLEPRPDDAPGAGILLRRPLPLDADARMVSNLRFGARMSYSDAQAELQVRLLPRSREGRKNGAKMDAWIGRWRDGRSGGGEVPEEDRTELSFVLYRVKATQYAGMKAGDTKGCPITVRYEYGGGNDNVSPQTIYALLKAV